MREGAWIGMRQSGVGKNFCYCQAHCGVGQWGIMHRDIVPVFLARASEAGRRLCSCRSPSRLVACTLAPPSTGIIWSRACWGRVRVLVSL